MHAHGTTATCLQASCTLHTLTHQPPSVAALQVRHLPGNQVTANVLVGLRPGATRPGLRVNYGAATVDAWGLLALQLAQHVHKGSRIQVKGMLREDTWPDKTTGQPRRLVKVGGWAGAPCDVGGGALLLEGRCLDVAIMRGADADRCACLRCLQVVAEELALLPIPESQQQDQDQELEASEQPVQQHLAPPQVLQPQPVQQPEAPQPPAQPLQQPLQQPQRQLPPRYTASAAASRQMYEEEGAGLEAVAAARGIKLSTVIDHLLAAAGAGAFSSWRLLASEVQLGPAGSHWLSPAEVAEAVAAVQQDSPGVELGQLSVGRIRQQLLAGPQTGPKAAALEAARGGDPALLYGAVKVVLAMLQLGVSFSEVSSE